MNGDNGNRFRGWTEAEIKNIKGDLAEIKDDIRTALAEIRSLREWKAAVIGICLGVSTFLGIIGFVIGKIEWGG